MFLSSCYDKLFGQKLKALTASETTFLVIAELHRCKIKKNRACQVRQNRPFALRGMWHRFYENESYMTLPSKND